MLSVNASDAQLAANAAQAEIKEAKNRATLLVYDIDGIGERLDHVEATIDDLVAKTLPRKTAGGIIPIDGHEWYQQETFRSIETKWPSISDKIVRPHATLHPPQTLPPKQPISNATAGPESSFQDAFDLAEMDGAPSSKMRGGKKLSAAAVGGRMSGS